MRVSSPPCAKLLNLFLGCFIIPSVHNWQPHYPQGSDLYTPKYLIHSKQE